MADLGARGRRLFVTVAALGLVAVVLAACAEWPVATDPLPPPAPVATQNEVPNPDGSVSIEPISVEVIPGVNYRLEIYTHCGLTPTTFDFDGSFWDVAGPSQGEGGALPIGIADPFDRGSIVVIGPDTAIWSSEVGVNVFLTRGAPGPRTRQICR